MTQGWRNFLVLLGIALLIYGGWYFRDLIAYVMVAVVISLVGAPVVNFLREIEFGKFRLPLWLCSLITLTLMVCTFAGLILIFGPLVAKEATAFSQIDVEATTKSLEGSLVRTEAWLSQFNFSGDERSNREYLVDELKQAINFSRLGDVFSDVFGILGNTIVAIFSILFMSFFFLKDASLFRRIVFAATPDKHLDRARNILKNTTRLLTRYFVALILQVTIYTVLVSSGLGIIGVKNAILIGFLAGIINLIPYIGPLIGGIVGVIIALGTHTDPDINSLLPLILKVGVVFLIAQLLDNLVVAPYIFSSSVNAHPLEIFLVISIAGTLAGIPGMILAIPGYTFIRIIAKEFLSEFKVVERLTRGIEN